MHHGRRRAEPADVRVLQAASVRVPVSPGPDCVTDRVQSGRRRVMRTSQLPVAQPCAIGPLVGGDCPADVDEKFGGVSSQGQHVPGCREPQHRRRRTGHLIDLAAEREVHHAIRRLAEARRERPDALAEFDAAGDMQAGRPGRCRRGSLGRWHSADGQAGQCRDGYAGHRSAATHSAGKPHDRHSNRSPPGQLILSAVSHGPPLLTESFTAIRRKRVNNPVARGARLSLWASWG